MIINEDDYLAHYGTPRHSGRYPWGSGGEFENIRNKSWLDYEKELRKQGLTEVEVARGMGMLNEKGEPSTGRLRARRTLELNTRTQADIAQAERLRAKGMSGVEIGRQMGRNESYIRTLLAPGAKVKADSLLATANMLKEEIDKGVYGDIGSGVEQHLNIAPTRLAAAVNILKEQGYRVHTVPVPQQTTAFDTNMKVLTPPGTTWGDVRKHPEKIQQIFRYTEDGGQSYGYILPPLSVNPNRVSVRYAEDGGDKSDGVIFVRPGVKDIELGNSRYAQVRIKVGEDHYLKGMAMYKDDLPPGTDLVFNTNKKKSEFPNKLDTMKPIKEDADNPFGAIVRQIKDRDENGNERVTSAMNMIYEQGDWGKWSRSLSSQFLSKQEPKLAKAQLELTHAARVREFEEISRLTNPTIKRDLLLKFASEADSAAVHLQAAYLPRQRQHVILPIESMKPSEVYAPGYRPGERVVLIRHPHGGTFEIPELVVNNSNREAKRLLGDTQEAIGIHSSVAERLSGADFDGDTVLVIPNNSGKVRITPALEGLRNFNPKEQYRAYPGMPKITDDKKQQEMGKISNLITDMTIHNAPPSEIVRAIRHSMVVIDSENHHLNYKQSAIDNNISELKAKYQGGANRGASTLISRAGAEFRIPQQKPRLASKGGPIDKETGKLAFEPTGKTSYKTGKERQTITEKLAATENAHVLSSGTPIERLYADHSNKLKTLANRARKDAVNTPPSEYSKSARKIYAKEVASLNAKYALAVRNRPLERQAQLFAGMEIKAKRAENPNMEKEVEKRMKYLALEKARKRTGADRNVIEITQEEWNAIQAGAITSTRLREILVKADPKIVRTLATPRVEIKMTASVTSRARQMLADGYTRAEVADHLGVSLSTLDKADVGPEQ